VTERDMWASAIRYPGGIMVTLRARPAFGEREDSTQALSIPSDLR